MNDVNSLNNVLNSEKLNIILTSQESLKLILAVENFRNKGNAVVLCFF